MVEFQGIPAYVPGESSDKRRVDADGSMPKNKPMGSEPCMAYQQVFNQPIRDYSTLQFQSTRPRLPLPPSAEPLKLPSLPITQANVGTLLQLLAGRLEGLISQVGAFFFSQRRNRPNEEDLEKRRLNDFFSLDFLGDRLGQTKVEASNQSAAGDGSQ